MAESSVELSTEVVLDLAEKPLIRVLHVDDEAGFLKVAKQCLEMQGIFEVDTALSVKEATEKMKKKTYDAVVSDYMMPEKNGLEFLEELRKKGNKIPFIMFTGRGREEVAIQALNYGADQYLNKTGEPETVYAQLAQSIRKAVKTKQMEEQLRESEEKYRSMVELAPVAIVTFDLKGVVTSCNTFVTLSGYSKDEIVGKYFSKIGWLRIKDMPKYLKAFSSIIRGKVPEPFEVIYRHKDGESHIGKTYVSLIKKNGKTVGIQSIMMDITEIKKKEKAIREAQEKFERLFMNNPEAADYLDTDFHILDVNPRFTELFGYSLAEVKGRHINDVVVPKDKMEEAEMLDKESKKGYAYYDTVRKRKDGTLVPVSIAAAPIIVEGQLVGTVGLYKDITMQKKAERELEESRRHFQALFNVMVDPVVIVDEKGKFLEVTDRVEEITGFKKEELLGKNFLRTKIVTAKSKAVLIKNLAKRMMGMHVVPYEVEVVRKDGRKRPYEVNAAKISYGGMPADMVVFRDVSERKKLEEKLRIVGRLTRHDVRNKLSAVTGNTFLAKQKLSDGHEVLEYLEEIESAVRQSVRIFDFARTYEMLGIEELAYMNVEKAVGGAVSLFSDLHGVRVINDCRGLTVLADSLLRQLFYNLIDNSLKYGEKISRIRVYYKEAGQNQLNLVYEDDGVGIAKAEKAKIFMEGYGKGSGYGLFLIRKMCEVYGWTIHETGKHGKGAEFTITIPKTSENDIINYQLSRNR
jgi:PAS domain S-box-containing protein